MSGHELCTIYVTGQLVVPDALFFERLMCYSRNFPMRG